MKKIIIFILLALFFLSACTHSKSIHPYLSLNSTIHLKKKLSKKNKDITILTTNIKNQQTKLVWAQNSKNIKIPRYVKNKLIKGEKIEVNLEYQETDISSVAKQILGDMLHLNYTIHPRVKGLINLRIVGKYTKEDIIQILKETFNLAAVSLIKKENIYEIVPSINGLKYSVNGDDISYFVYSPKFVTPRDIQVVILNFLSEKGKSFINNRKNYIIIEDKKENIFSISNLIKTIDVDILKNKEIRIYKLAYSSPKEIAKELNYFLQGLGISKNESKYAIIPIERLNYIILISSTKEIINQMESIIKLLDVGEKDAQKKVYVYKVQYVKAKDLANTLISFFTGKKKIEVKKIQGQKIQKIASSMLKEEVIIIPDETTNYLLIEATPTDYLKIINLIKILDAMPRQVLIEVLIAEVSLNNDFEHGLEWWLNKNKNKYNFSTGIQYGLLGKQNSLIGFTYYGVKPSDFWNFMYFLTTKSSLQVLSSPHITVRNNETAYINVGEEVPIATGETIGNVQTNGTSAIERRIEYKNVGTMLKVTPHISEDGFVSLEIEQEVSNAQSNTVSGIDSPIISTRKTKTTLMVQDEHSIIIGGIIKHKKDKTRKSIPILGDIPLLGNLFSYTYEKKENTELIIMLTPHVIKTPQDADILTNLFKNRLDKLKKTGFVN